MLTKQAFRMISNTIDGKHRLDSKWLLLKREDESVCCRIPKYLSNFQKGDQVTIVYRLEIGFWHERISHCD